MTIRQYQMMKQLRLQRWSIAAVEALNQLTFGSLCRRRWLEFNFKQDPSDGWFEWSASGRDKMMEIQGVDFRRNHPENPLSKYVPPAARRGHRMIHAGVTQKRRKVA